MLNFLTSYNFTSYFEMCDIESLWSYLKLIIFEAIHLYTPRVSSRSHEKPKWFTSDLRHTLNCVHSLRRKQSKKPSANLQIKLADAELSLQKDMIAAKAAFESSLIHNFATTNSNKIFKYISSVNKSCTLPTTMCFKDISESSDKGIAQLFNNYFFSVYTDNCPSDFSIDTLSNNNNGYFNDVYFTPYDILDILSSLDLNKAMGIDHLSPKVLRHCAPALHLPIYHLFSQCFQQSSLPREWKIHCITPIFKSGDRMMVSNYRPISLLCVISKVLERLVYNNIIHFLDGTFSKFQFGFLPGRSSLQQLLIFINEILNAKQTNNGMDVLYLDISKAFDSVAHHILLTKLHKCGISGKLLKWLHAYLTDRSQCVCINNQLSDLLPVTSGVPQGSILGPLLFAIYINDLPACIGSSRPLLFADDTKCFKTISRCSDISSLQQDLNQLSIWSTTNCLLFNESKSTHLHFWNQFGTHQYNINGKAVTTSDQHKDLGIFISSNLNFSLHHETVSSKAYRMLGLLRRTFVTHSTIVKKKLYLSLIRSQLTYCSQIWRPFLRKDILFIERIQRRATKYILNDYNSSYKSRLIQLKLLPLMYLFDFNDLIFFIKSYKSPSHHFDINNYISFSHSSTRSSSNNKLTHIKSTCNLDRHFYFCRLPRQWNALPFINLNLPFNKIKDQILGFLWKHFIDHFVDDNTCSFQLVCPCNNCMSKSSCNFCS